MKSRKSAVVTPKSTNPVAKKTSLDLADIASDENTGISRVLAEVDIDSCEFIETLTAIDVAPMYQRVRSALKLEKGTDFFALDLLAARMYLAGRFDQRGAPATL